MGAERRVPRAGLREEGGARGAAVHGRRRAGAAAGRAARTVRAAPREGEPDAHHHAY